MRPHVAAGLLAVLCLGLTFTPALVLAGANGGVCAAQLEKCLSRCFGSAVCQSRCAANDRACRVGAKPVYR
jgi:hypothetical protein